MESRNFKLDTEANIIHYPYRPNGFGILILGDERHFVENKNSFWTQNEGKKALLEKFKDAGYTIFYSNLYGVNWGSPKAVELAGNLCAYVRRSEILNGKFHILAEGMGALTALKLVRKEQNFRSLLLLNPILSLQKHLEQEKEHKFFYKKLIHEIAASYQIHVDEVPKLFNSGDDFPKIPKETQTKIIQVLSGGRSFKQSEMMKVYFKQWEKEQVPISISFLVSEKMSLIAPKAIEFYKQNELLL